MVNQYIENLLLETNEDLERFQYQLADLMEELKYSQEKQEKLQRERNRDSNIFSPRSMTFAMDEKLDKAKEEVKSINQQVEYIREKIENSTKKKLEYETLLDELEKKEEKNGSEKKNESADAEEEKNEGFGKAAELKKTMSSYFERFTNENSQKEKDSSLNQKSENNKTEETQGKTASEQNVYEKETIDAAQLKNFLQNIYKSTEICLALVNGDKNRCKNELKKMKTEIKRFSEEIENK